MSKNLNEWHLMEKAFIQYRDDATLVAIPAPVTGYFAGVIRHRGGAYIMPPVDFCLTLNDALKEAEKESESTVTTTPAAKEETPKQIANKIACRYGYTVGLYSDILSALRNEREACAKVAEIIREGRFDLDHEPAQTERQIRNGIAAAIRERTE